jgi:hypothetical protein
VIAQRPFRLHCVQGQLSSRCGRKCPLGCLCANRSKTGSFSLLAHSATDHVFRQPPSQSAIITQKSRLLQRLCGALLALVCFSVALLIFHFWPFRMNLQPYLLAEAPSATFPQSNGNRSSPKACSKWRQRVWIKYSRKCAVHVRMRSVSTIPIQCCVRERACPNEPSTQGALKAAFMAYRARQRGESAEFSAEELSSCMQNRSPGAPDLVALSFNRGFHGRLFGSLSLTRSKAIHKVTSLPPLSPSVLASGYGRLMPKHAISAGRPCFRLAVRQLPVTAIPTGLPHGGEFRS